MQLNPVSSFQVFAVAAEPLRFAERDTVEDDLHTIGTVISLPRGRVLFAEGDRADGLYRVASGVLRTCRFLPDGRRQIDSFAMAGAFIGVEARDTHIMGAEAITDATLVHYSRARIERLAESDSRITRHLLDITTRQLADAHQRLLLLGRKTAEEKLATFLLEMLDCTYCKDAIELPMSRSDVADYLGLAVETVSRTFTAFRHQGILALADVTHVKILRRDALEEMTGED
jgi:CRP/FNR family nitrogen fixation transcriptional regulator